MLRRLTEDGLQTPELSELALAVCSPSSVLWSKISANHAIFAVFLQA